jgi:hypothetical protein
VQKTKPNLTRMYTQLVETYWMESECIKVERGLEEHKCFELFRSREAQLCTVCRGFVTLKGSMRLALEQHVERRKNSSASAAQ